MTLRKPLGGGHKKAWGRKKKGCSLSYAKGLCIIQTRTKCGMCWKRKQKAPKVANNKFSKKKTGIFKGGKWSLGGACPLG